MLRPGKEGSSHVFKLNLFGIFRNGGEVEAYPSSLNQTAFICQLPL